MLKKEASKFNLVKWLVLIFACWQLVLLLLTYVSQFIIKLRPDYVSEFGGRANFDGMHYLTIAERGYQGFQQAFFPFYPYLIHFFSKFIFHNYFVSGLFISNLSILITLFLFYKLVRLDFSEKIAQTAIIFLLIFPSSFFFGSVYTESLFLVLVIGSFYAARKKQWLLAGLLGGMASATRLVGLFLFPALLIEWGIGQKKKQKLRFVNLLPIFLILCGTGFYMWYLKKTVGDPLYFIHVQPMFGANRTGGKLILLYQVFWRYLKMILTTKMNVLYFTVWLELLTSIIFLLLSVFTYYKMRLSYFVFMILAYLIPTLTGTFLSMPRFMLALFPGFIILAIFSEKHSWFKIIYPVVSGILLVISTILFIRGYFVA
jgi:Gpi18-like mannosyltransferase